MSKQLIKATIDANIKQNGVQAITGQIMNSVLNQMVDNLAEEASTTEKLTELEQKVDSLQNALTISLPNPGYITVTGVAIPSVDTYSNSDFVPVNGGETIVLTGWPGSGVLAVAGYDANKNFTTAILQGESGESFYGKTAIIPDGVKYIRVALANETHTRYIPISVSIGIEYKTLQEKFDDLSTHVDDLSLQVERKYYLSAEGEIVSSPNDGFAQFAGAVATFDTDHYSVDCSQSTGYCGLRNNLLGAQIRQKGKKCRISFWVKSEDTAHTFILFYAPDTGKYFQLTNEWKEYTFDFNETEVATIDRIQFAFLNSTSIFDIKGLSILVGGSVLFDIDDLSSQVEELSSQVDDLSSKQYPLKGKKVSIIGDSISSSARNNAPYWLIVASDVGNQIQSYVTWADIYADWNGTTPTNKTIGGVLLTEEMVGTLQTFTPVAEDIGKTLGKGQVYNSGDIITWSERLCQKSGAIWLSNAAWSSARMTTGNFGTDDGQIAGSTGYSDCTIGRLRKRKDDGSFETPDVVLIYMGTNDMTHNTYAHIDDIDIMGGIPQNDLIDGVHQYKAAYYRCIQKVREAYPNATIICCTLNVFKRINYAQFPTNNGIYTLPQMNDAIREIANTMGCGLIEFDKDGITFENCYPTYISDSATEPTHPNNTGHEVMAMKALADITYCL